jgi:hypothetical protein
MAYFRTYSLSIFFTTCSHLGITLACAASYIHFRSTLIFLFIIWDFFCHDLSFFTYFFRNFLFILLMYCSFYWFSSFEILNFYFNQVGHELFPAVPKPHILTTMFSIFQKNKFIQDRTFLSPQPCPFQTFFTTTCSRHIETDMCF